jgi:hypothetical protein
VRLVVLVVSYCNFWRFAQIFGVLPKTPLLRADFGAKSGFRGIFHLFIGGRVGDERIDVRALKCASIEINACNVNEKKWIQDRFNMNYIKHRYLIAAMENIPGLI